MLHLPEVHHVDGFVDSEDREVFHLGQQEGDCVEVVKVAVIADTLEQAFVTGGP